MSDCLFCKIVAGNIPSEMVYQDDEVVAFKDIRPQAPVHILIIPRKHMAKVAEMEEGDQALMGKLIYTATRLAREMNISEDGFRLVFNNGENAGQEVFHIHLHLLGGRSMQWPPG